MTDQDVRLVQALSKLGAEHEPPPGWEARVLAAVEPRPRRSWWWFAAPAFALAALLVLLSPWRRPRPEALALKVERTPSAQRIRGSEAGGRIRATARGGERHRAIWVYRDARELVAVCPAAGGSAAAGAAVTSTACYRDGDALLLELGVERVGTYRVIALGAAAELPVPRGGFDGDLAAAITAGAASRQQDVEVQ